MANDIFPGAKLMQLTQWGFPPRSERGAINTHKGFSVIHITGNSRLPSAENECAWRQSLAADQGNSATFFVNRDGSVVQALGDPLHMDPWSNGDLKQPDMGNPRIAACVADGVNPNMRTLVSIENVGYEPGSSITAAQEKADAAILAYYHGKAGIPVTRESVVGHYQINGDTRPNCPARNKSVIDRIVELATVGPAESPNVIFTPVKVFPADTRVVFEAGTEYKLFTVNAATGEVRRRKMTPSDPIRRIGLGRFSIDGDTEHLATAYVQGDGSIGYVSGWGPAPRIRFPATTEELEGKIAALEGKVAAGLTSAKGTVAVLS